VVLRDREESIRHFHLLHSLRLSHVAQCDPLWCLQLQDPVGIANVGLSHATPRIPQNPQTKGQEPPTHAMQKMKKAMTSNRLVSH